MARYSTTFRNNEEAQSFFAKYGIKPIVISAEHASYFVDVDDSSILDGACIHYEYRPIGQPCWRPINWGYRIQVGALYNDYIIHRFIDGFDLADANDMTPYYMRGPWYVMTGYMGLLDAWNVTMGSGVTVSCQEKFDYTHPGYHVTDAAWNVTDYGNTYDEITGGSHSFFVISDTSTPEISGLLNRCFFYESGDQYSLTDGSGCAGGELPYYSGYSYFEPGLCYTGWFTGLGGDETCESGLWNWTTDAVPSGFSPFGHGDITTSVFGARVTPVDTLTGWGDIIGNVGISPRCNILLGNAQDTYTVAESALGLDVRIGAFDGQWSQAEADAAYATGTMLVRSVGSFINCDTVMHLDQTVPTKTVSVGAARWRGSDYNVFTQDGQDLTTTGNFGTYAGYGRHNNVMFATPAVGVWCHHPRYNHNGWGAWSGAYDGPSVAASVGGGLLALMKSQHPTWSWEDIITAICQSCRPSEFRVVPPHHAKFGETVLAETLASSYYGGSDSFHVSGNAIVDDSTAWYCAFPSGYDSPHGVDVYGRPYGIIQFGEGPDDPEYELLCYGNISSDGTVVSGGEGDTYSGGQFQDSYLGYGGSRSRLHVTGDSIHASLLTYSGWSPYLGWGIPNMKSAVSITKNTLDILPPQRFAVSGFASEEEYYNNKIRLEITPFRSSNYDGVIVVKSPIWYPRNPKEGTICFKSNNANYEVITGWDFDITNTPVYYTAFQYTKGPNVRYSKPATYAAAFFDGYDWGKHNLHLTEIEDKLIIRLSQPGNSEYAIVSGYWLLPTPSQYKGFHESGYVTMTGMSKGDSVILGIYGVAHSENMSASYNAVAGFNHGQAISTWDATRADYEYFCHGNPENTYVQWHHDSFYGPWSQCMTVSGDTEVPASGATWIGIEGNDIARYMDYYDTFNLSIYAKVLQGSGTMDFGINVYDNTLILLSSLVISSVDIANTDWERYNCVYTSGEEWPGMPQEIHPFVRFASNTPGEYSTIVVSNPQTTSGEALKRMSVYPLPRYTDVTIDNNISLALGLYTFQGNPSTPSGATVDMYNGYFNIQVDRDIDDTDSGMRIYGTNNNVIAFITGYGSYVSSQDTPTKIEVINAAGRTSVCNNITIHDYRPPIAGRKYARTNEQGVFTDPWEPSFEDGVTSNGSFLLELTTGDHYVPTGLHPVYETIVPINITRRHSNVSATVALWYEYDGTAYHIETTHENSVLYFRKPKEDTLKFQAITMHGNRIESNVLYYTNE